MKENKKRNSKIVPICLILTILGTIIYILSTYEKIPDNDVIINQNGINLKMLSSTENNYGELTYVFEYQIIPENATNQEVTLSLIYKDNGQEITNSEFSYELNQELKQIKIICHKAFNRTILLKITSNQNNNAYAEVKLEYSKKLLNLDYKTNDYYIGGQSNHNNLQDFTATSFIEPTYSLYTKDQEYTFKAESFALSYESENYSIPGSLPSTFVNNLINLLNNKFINQEKSITPQEIWNLTSDNKTHSFLSKLSQLDYKDNYIEFLVDEAKYYCVEKPEIVIDDPQRLTFVFYLDFDFTNFTINTENIIVDFEEIIF